MTRWGAVGLVDLYLCFSQLLLLLLIYLFCCGLDIVMCGAGIEIMQSLEFVADTRILMEMKIENRGKIYFPWKKFDKCTFFSMKIKMMEL